MHTDHTDEATEIPAAIEVRPVLDYAKPNPPVSVWQVAEAVMRYGFVFVLIGFLNMIFQIMIASVLANGTRATDGGSSFVPYGLFGWLIVGIPPLLTLPMGWKIIRPMPARFAMCLCFVGWSWGSFITNASNFAKLWSHGW